ncbi:PREDICTED: egg cell-secreted protein 1.1-like [Camelina sativa]|uniref:Egg cell-secreted protein 1.1-like n=1 Tax=Camelina sativa TaxID=90675 RepID=A0ABM0VSI6_CAMSA|nr:PREDICTED: egg cell-secreted protein 1.1-like [Camelina sativa]
MESKARVMASLVLVVVVCALVLITPGVVAHDQKPPQPKSPPSSPIDLEKCWSSLFNVNGCVLELIKSVFSGKFGNFGVACCKAYSAIDANCWPHMFPLNPFFPPLLKDNCARIIPNLPAHK